MTEAVAAGLASLSEDLVSTQPLRAAEAADRISLLVSKVVGRVVSSFDEGSRTQAAVAVAREIVDRLAQEHPAAGVSRERPDDAGTVLRAILRRRPDGSPEQVVSPLIPLLDTTLLTNSPGEPSVGHQLATEIQGADGIDLVMAFIRRSGIRSIEEDLARHCSRGRRLRVLTTTYTGSTERAALDALTRAGRQVRVSYDTSTTRLHAKAWLFHRECGFSTAYIGSSNLTHSAQVAGLEWNVRVSGARNPEVIDKVAAIFEATGRATASSTTTPSPSNGSWGRRCLASSLPESGRGHSEALPGAPPGAAGSGARARLPPEPAGGGDRDGQDRHGGRRLRPAPCRASLGPAPVRRAPPGDPRTEPRDLPARPARRSFGELWVGGRRPAAFNHVFASIQSLDAAGLAHLDPQHFDVVVVDEFHHAAAATYGRLLAHVEPRELLGLTATPERSDGEPILEWFGGRIAAELRLWDAIDQQYLTPFAYYGIADETDLTTVPWQRGRGYDVDALTNIFTSDDAWARRVLHEVTSHVELSSAARPRLLRQRRARRVHGGALPRAGVPGGRRDRQTPEASGEQRLWRIWRPGRRGVLRRPVQRRSRHPGRRHGAAPEAHGQPDSLPSAARSRVAAIAGQDILHRPRLRGQHRKEFRFDRRFRALLGGSRQDLERQVKAGFPFLPAGCRSGWTTSPRNES